MTRRRLTAEEVDLWRKVTEQVSRLHPERARADDLTPKPKPKPMRQTFPALPEFRVGQNAQTARAHDVLAPVEERVAKHPVQMDAKAFQRMKRGKLVPEARLDLHGLTLERAHPALVSFILRSQAQGLRLVLVITGKGERGGPHPATSRERGVLRRQVPQWLHAPALRPAILQVDQAHISHGGEGAYYVYLKKRR